MRGHVKPPPCLGLGVPGDPGDKRASDRGALVGGLTFVEGVASGWRRAALEAWIWAHLVSPGRMLQPSAIREPPYGPISLGGDAPESDDFPKLLARARSNAVEALRAFIGTPPSDAFVRAAIFADRAQRRRVDARSVWVARPTPTDTLGEVVLSLFAVDLLMHRELHEAKLCVCGVCGRVSFQPALTSRHGCSDHPSGSDNSSGFVPASARCASPDGDLASDGEDE